MYDAEYRVQYILNPFQKFDPCVMKGIKSELIQQMWRDLSESEYRGPKDSEIEFVSTMRRDGSILFTLSADLKRKK